MLTFPSFSLNISIEYDLVILGDNRYQYIYTITNKTSSDNTHPLQLFDISFDSSLYAENSLMIKTPAAIANHWTENLLFSITDISPIYDVFSSTGIADNQSVTGFSVEFTWLGTAMPLTQTFKIYNPDDLTLLEVGTTQLRQILTSPPVTVPPVVIPPVNNAQNNLQAVPLFSLPFFYLLNIGFFLLVFFHQPFILSRFK